PVVDVNIPYENDVYNAQEIIESINKKVFNETDMFMTEPEIIGVQSLDVSHYIIRIISETSPGNQWAAERYLRGEIKSVLNIIGVQSLYVSHYFIRIISNTSPCNHWAAERY